MILVENEDNEKHGGEGWKKGHDQTDRLIAYSTSKYVLPGRKREGKRSETEREI